ncbi:MAG: type I CRISPR-associated protein Cas7 [Rhodocyclaceae bacterium]|nr:type I CRISPR-associated protein Cas7 [Rhodocyclaceae bacterium]MDP3031961.1 type I CRISPR-associated protein Cas7 [Rhodocyclaceae bacterium]
MSPQLAECTGFTAEDATVIKTWLPKLFENGASSARPDCSMEVVKVVWWQHDSKAGKYSSAKVHGSLAVAPDGSISLADIRVRPEIIEGF